MHAGGDFVRCAMIKCVGGHLCEEPDSMLCARDGYIASVI